VNAGTWLLVAAVVINGLLVGASLDQSIKQLPARRRIGALAYSEYSKAADLGNGIAWYVALGAGGAILTLVAAGTALAGRPGSQARALLWLGVLLTVAHSVATGRAAPTNFSQRGAAGDAQRLTVILDRFARIQTVRAVLQTATLLVLVWAMVAAFEHW
jgi:hypothetical protein